MRQINQIIVHCSDSPFDHHDDISIIREWHLERGFYNVGYHYFIQADGTIQVGRGESIIGAHCFGQNRDSIGICLHGRFEFTRKQFASLARLFEDIKKRYKIKRVAGHWEYDKNKTCPNFSVMDILNKSYYGTL